MILWIVISLETFPNKFSVMRKKRLICTGRSFVFDTHRHVINNLISFHKINLAFGVTQPFCCRKKKNSKGENAVISRRKLVLKMSPWFKNDIISCFQNNTSAFISYLILSFFRLVSGRNSTNPAIWLGPGEGGIYQYVYLIRRFVV